CDSEEYTGLHYASFPVGNVWHSKPWTGGGRALEGTVGDLRSPTPSAPRPAVIVSLTPGTMWMIGHAIRTVRATKACPLAEAGWSEARHGRLLHNGGQLPYNGGQLLHNSGQLLPDCDAYACPRRVWALCRSAATEGNARCGN